MVQDRIIFSGSFLYRFEEISGVFGTLCKNSPGISHMWPVFRRYAMLFLPAGCPHLGRHSFKNLRMLRLGNSQIKIPVELLHTGVIVRMIYSASDT